MIESNILIFAAARRVVEKGVHMLSGKMFNMKFPVFKKEMLDVEKGNETHISSNFDCGNIIEIHGDIGDFGNDILEMYLESPRRSGGGEIEKLKMDVNPPCAAFRDSEGKCYRFVFLKRHTYQRMFQHILVQDFILHNTALVTFSYELSLCKLITVTCS